MGSAVGWFKSSHSNDSTACVEVGFDGSRVLVRDSKFQGSPDAWPTLAFTPTQWAAFTAAIRASEPA
ncbi:DUF397 domain-containing protein [Nocardia gipuzkoensis]|uniref:DUF397 domain-containing protein n=1 Tax=Nocardia gipuzkoensis TaxID=2749991 RepID=UPI001E5421F1|nr:DUF397 domain-containing protein [Nocardia gipuzkoensis]UGT70330.1 DUF397 domain-containing protein [Nocardia gipuzkoensis]